MNAATEERSFQNSTMMSLSYGSFYIGGRCRASAPGRSVQQPEPFRAVLLDSEGRRDALFDLRVMGVDADGLGKQLRSADGHFEIHVEANNRLTGA